MRKLDTNLTALSNGLRFFSERDASCVYAGLLPGFAYQCQLAFEIICCRQSYKFVSDDTLGSIVTFTLKSIGPGKTFLVCAYRCLVRPKAYHTHVY